MSKWTQLSREFLGGDDLKMSNEDALKLLDAIETDIAEIARLTRERDDLREALHAMMTAVIAFQNDDARRPDFTGNPYNCPMPWQGETLLKAYDLASIARANSPINTEQS